MCKKSLVAAGLLLCGVLGFTKNTLCDGFFPTEADKLKRESAYGDALSKQISKQLIKKQTTTENDKVAQSELLIKATKDRDIELLKTLPQNFVKNTLSEIKQKVHLKSKLKHNFSISFIYSLYSASAIPLTEKEALAHYLYNMYIASAYLSGESLTITIDMRFLGVLNPIYNYIDERPSKAPYKGGDWKDVYNENKDYIKQSLKTIFAEVINFNYDSIENIFIRALVNAKDGNYDRYCHKKVRQNDLQAPPADLLRQVAEDAQANFDRNESLSITYSYKLTFKVNEQCALNSYLFAKFAAPKYGDWLVRAKILLWASKLKPADGGLYFKSPQGKSYPHWMYHAATLLVLQNSKDNKIIELISDPFLLKEPAPLGEWTKLFDETTCYRPYLYRDKPTLEEKLKGWENLPSQYRPQ